MQRGDEVRIVNGASSITILIERMHRPQSIKQVIQRALDDPAEIYTYQVSRVHQLSFLDGFVTLDWIDGDDLIGLADTPLCIDLAEALIAAEAVVA